jgi:rfaE bifunctional protein kinase chain/domain
LCLRGFLFTIWRSARKNHMTDFDQLFSGFKHIKAGVVGDVMLDTYWWGHVERISPEAPVPIVNIENREYRIGGAGNVALNLSSLQAQVTIFSMTGLDDDRNILKELLERNDIQTQYLLSSLDRITTNKTRIFGRNQQMMRLDSETTKDLVAAEEDKLIEAVKRFIELEKPSVMIFEDYNKGVLTERVIGELIAICQRHKIFTAVDPKTRNFFSYKGVDLFKPNLKEVREGLNLIVQTPDLNALTDIHEQLAGQLDHLISFITLSERGVFCQVGKEARIIPSYLRSVADVSGAGDTVIAVAALVYAATRNVSLMAEVANIAGGLVCEEVGTVAINRARLLEECKLLLGTD